MILIKPKMEIIITSWKIVARKIELKVTPVKTGDTTLKLDYITDSGENKTVSYEINVRKGLSLEIENK